MRRETSRRRLIAAVGAGTATAIAGCNDAGGEPSYEDGTVEEEDGEERSAEEMAAAAALAGEEPHESVTPLEALEVTDHEYVIEDGYTGPTIQGTVENTGDRIEVVEVHVRVYDDEGAQLGRYLDRTGDLDGGGQWSFTVVLLEAPEDIANYDITTVGTPA